MSKRTRRRALPALAALAVTLGLAACGGGSSVEGGGGSASSTTAKSVKLTGTPSGNLTISNWPLYIDKKTVKSFQTKTGISVKYIEDVNDNAEFFGKMQPLLAKGQSGGRSIFVVTDWMASKMHQLGYLQNFDKSGIPNVEANLVAPLQHPAFDPNRDFSAPWQSGMTGVIVRTDLAPDVHSICDLFNPKYKGKVDMLTEMYDTVPLVMKCMGIDPNKATDADWSNAINKIKGAADSGQIRHFTGNDYAKDLTSGNASAVIGWSGDAVQLQADNKNIQWRMPTEGCMLWADNMVIPVGAPNATAAEAWINSTYDPKVEAQIEDFVNYVDPVNGVKQVLQKSDPAAAKNTLIFPSVSFTQKCSPQPQLTQAREQKYARQFDAVLNG